MPVLYPVTDGPEPAPAALVDAQPNHDGLCAGKERRRRSRTSGEGLTAEQRRQKRREQNRRAITSPCVGFLFPCLSCAHTTSLPQRTPLTCFSGIAARNCRHRRNARFEELEKLVERLESDKASLQSQLTRSDAAAAFLKTQNAGYKTLLASTLSPPSGRAPLLSSPTVPGGRLQTGQEATVPLFALPSPWPLDRLLSRDGDSVYGSVFEWPRRITPSETGEA